MRENMVRFQVYLPRSTYERLQKRASQHELTLATQVRAALDDYLERVESHDDDGILHADDPIFQMIGMFSSKEGDLSINHDHYLYGWPKREEVNVVREKPSKPYKGKSTSKRSKRK
jgi:N-acetyl-beta-hexosaminidase